MLTFFAQAPDQVGLSPSSMTFLGSGLLAFLFLKLILDFLREQRKEKDPPPNQESNQQVMDGLLKSSVLPLLERQIEILSELRTAHTRENEMMIRMGIQLEEALKGIDRLRVSNHEIVAAMQEIAGKQSDSCRYERRAENRQ